jgi:long-chain fatty acid transport protein
MKKVITLLLLLTANMFAAGYQISNNSVNSLALSTANVAHADGADTSYNNPANMVQNDIKHNIEISATYVYMESGKCDSTDDNFHIESDIVQIFIPSIHYVSKKLNDKGVRIGFSIVSPAGLTRKWQDIPAIATAKKYSLQTIELNPTVAIPLTNNLSVCLGFRYVIATAEIALDAGNVYSLNMKGSGEAAG